MSVFIIAEAGSSWDGDCHKAERLIHAAKECGANAVKFQWTSDPAAMAKRRGLGADAEAMYRKYLAYPAQFLTDFKRICDTFKIQFLCTVYLPEDVQVVAPLVSMFKVSAFESQDREFLRAHCHFEKAMIISVNHGKPRLAVCSDTNYLYCVSEYPTPLENVKLSRMQTHDGWSDHTANVLAGAAAVAAGAQIVEAHIRLGDTSPDNPDYGHSLEAPCVTCGPHGDPQGDWGCDGSPNCFRKYVANIRTVERML